MKMSRIRKFTVPEAHKALLASVTESEEEIWAPHPKWPMFYASSLGRVASIAIHDTRIKLLKFGKKLEIVRGTVGKNYKRKQFLPHRFVWECFHGVVNDKRQIVFEDGNPANIALSNLRLVEPSERIKLQNS